MGVRKLENQSQVLQHQMPDLRANVDTKREITKDLSVVPLIPHFSGAINTIIVHEFITVNGVERISALSDVDNTYAANMKQV